MRCPSTWLKDLSTVAACGQFSKVCTRHLKIWPNTSELLLLMDSPTRSVHETFRHLAEHFGIVATQGQSNMVGA